jgi:hypothetical protein
MTADDPKLDYQSFREKRRRHGDLFYLFTNQDDDETNLAKNLPT